MLCCIDTDGPACDAELERVLLPTDADTFLEPGDQVARGNEVALPVGGTRSSIFRFSGLRPSTDVEAQLADPMLVETRLLLTATGAQGADSGDLQVATLTSDWDETTATGDFRGTAKGPWEFPTRLVTFTPPDGLIDVPLLRGGLDVLRVGDNSFPSVTLRLTAPNAGAARFHSKEAAGEQAPSLELRRCQAF